MRVLVCTADACGVGFNIPVAELISSRDLARHRQLRALGPDLLAQPFDRAEAIRRIARTRQRRRSREVLLNQRVLAGIGNVFKSEILFLAGLDPFAAVAALTDADLERIVDIARQLLAANVMAPVADAEPGASADGRRAASIPTKSCGCTAAAAGRAGGAAPRFSRRKSGLDARLTYWCPTCQPIPCRPSTR